MRKRKRGERERTGKRRERVREEGRRRKGNRRLQIGGGEKRVKRERKVKR